jgi:peptide/nickel transport system permease protein
VQLQFLARRLAMLLATLLVSSFVIFSALYLAPGNPIAVLSGGRSLPPESVKVLEDRYHLNDPFLTQYWIWLTNALHGDLGISILLRTNVSDLIVQRAGTTAGLVLYSAIIIVILGVGLGLLGGLKPGWIDTSVIVTSAISAALPSFVAAIVLTLVFSVSLGWFPSLGTGTGFVDSVYHLTLPAVALALSSLAIVARVTRASVREEFGREHVQTAISRGIPYAQLVRRHVLRNAAIPITTVSGITIASLIAGAAVVERAFGLNGLGAYLVLAAGNKDFAVVQGISLVLVATFVVVNLVVDVLYAVLDPRITLGSRAQ